MPDTDQLHVPAGSCRGSCNLKAAKAYAAYRQAIEDHADAVDAWYAAGGHGEPPAEPEEPRARFWPGNPLFCGRCLANTRRTLLDLDVLAAQLAATADGYRGRAPFSQGVGPVSGTRTRPSVSPAADTLDQLLGDLFDAEDTWRRLRGYPGRDSRSRRGAHPRTRTIGWLAEHLADMLAHPDLAYLPRKLHSWNRVLRYMVKDDRASAVSPIRCPRCLERRVAWDEDVHYYVCRSCETYLTQDEHDQRVQEQAEAAEAAKLARAR